MHDVMPLDSSNSPRAYIAENFSFMYEDLPIHGGWGYTKTDACIIDRSDPAAGPYEGFDGLGVERAFVEARICLEFTDTRPEGERFYGLEWRLLKQELVGLEAGTYDYLVFEITGIPERSWEPIRDEYWGPDGCCSPDFDEAVHQAKRDAVSLKSQREFWFEISSFFGRT